MHSHTTIDTASCSLSLPKPEYTKPYLPIPMYVTQVLFPSKVDDLGLNIYEVPIQMYCTYHSWLLTFIFRVNISGHLSAGLCHTYMATQIML